MATNSRPYSSPNYKKEEEKKKDSRPYSSPNYPKEEPKKESKPVQDTRPYSSPNYPQAQQPTQQQKQQQQNKPAAVSQPQQQQNQQQQFQYLQPAQQQQQQRTVETFINSLSNDNVANLKKNTDVAEKLNTRPIQPLKNNKLLQYQKDKQRPYSSPNYGKEVQKNLEAADDKEVKASNLDKYASEVYWSKGRKQSVSYATTIEYYDMERRGYETVFIEDGTGALENKGGIYTIGRDNLAGVPSGVRTVLVDNEGNWKYLADTTERADHVEALTNKLDAINKDFEDTIHNNVKLRDTAYNSRLYKQMILNMTLNQSDLKKNNVTDEETLQQIRDLVGSIDSYNEIINDCNTRIESKTKQWAKDYEFYDIAIGAHQKWTVEDEAQFQTLRDNLLNHYVPEEEIANATAAFIEMRNRREKNKDCAAFLDKDYINKLKETEDAMQKAVDEYNKWDSLTIHTEKGEDIGTQVKRLMILNVAGASAYQDPNYIMEKDRAYTGLISGLKKNFSPIGLAIEECRKANNAYDEVNKRIANGEYANEEELADLYAKRLDYLKASNNAVAQGKAVLFNNIISDLSVFDVASIQSTFVAWRMAKHEDRYSDDPKWAKMKEAYKAIYGTDFNGKMDAGKMAQAMLQVKLGTSGVDSDYIYLDGSDLRHSNGEKYGLGASLAVGMLTDIGFLFTAGKTVAGATTKMLGAKALTKAASDSYLQALVRSGVAQEAAEELVKSKAVQKALYKDIKKAIGKNLKESGDDITKLFKESISDRAEVFKSAFAKDIGASVDDTLKIARKTDAESSLSILKNRGLIADEITTGIDEARYANFLKTSRETIMASDNITRATLQIEKGTLLTNALGTFDDALNEMQSALFKVTCPAAGAVVGIAKSNKAIKALVNSHLANKEIGHRLVETGQLVQAKIANMSFDDILDGVGFNTKCNQILDEWAYGVMGANKANTALSMEHARLFCQYQDNIMREVSNSYTSRVINELDHVMSERGIAGLEELATSKGFGNFDEMFDTIKTNISVMYDHSPDARSIVNAFSSTYSDAVTAINIQHVKQYVEFADKHVDYIKKNLNINKNSILSPVNALAHPAFVQGTAMTTANNIRDFLRTVNNDYTLFTDAAGATHSIHEAGVRAIDALELLSFDVHNTDVLRYAQDSLSEYLDEMENIYMKRLKDWENNTIQDALGVQNYLDNITSIVPEHGGNREVINSVADGMQKFFEEQGINMSRQDILDNIIKENPNDFLKLTDREQQAVIYRIMENKGSNIIGQVSDSDLKIITDELNDCNSQLNKNLRLLQLEMNDGSAAREYITQAITNGSAVANSRMVYNALKAEGVESSMCLAVMDAFSSNPNYVNSVVQSYPPDIAASKICDYIVDEAKKQFSLHNGTYSLFTEMGCSGVDVSANVLNIEKNLAEYIPEDDQYIDICVSMIRSTDGTAPKDVAFHIRGSVDEPTVFRKNGKFTVYDDNFAKRTYGRTAQQLNDSYAALGDVATLSDDDWIKQFQDYINAQKQIALDNNKTIRFIGFNSSDAVSGGNKFLSDTLRSCGVNANTANAIDMADILRAKRGEYVFNSKDLAAINRSVRTAVDVAGSRSVSLGISSVIAYDPKYTCVDMINNALKNTKFGVSALDEQAKYILENMRTVSKRLGTEAYNDLGQAMGAYIDATAFAKVLQDAGLSTVHANGDIMRIVTEATVSGETKLGLHKIVEEAMDAQWIDKAKFTGSIAVKDFNSMERMHDSILQINRINNSLHRTDLITHADVENLNNILDEIRKHTGISYHNSQAYAILRSLKVDELSPQQLYSATKWLLDSSKKFMKPESYDEFFSVLLLKYPEQVTKLTDMGYKFIRDNIVDYTNDSIDAFLVKYLDTSEEGYKFAQDLQELRTLYEHSNNTKMYMDAVEGLFKRYDVHGVQDRMILYQLADVHNPIIGLHDEMKTIYERAYSECVDRLRKDADLYAIRKHGQVSGGRYDEKMIDRIATEEGVRAAKEHIIKLGETNRNYAVQDVANLNEQAFKAHLVRNCCGGMIIDPTAKCVEGVDLVTLFEQWKSYKGVRVETINFSDVSGRIKDRKLFKISLEDLDGADMDKVFREYDKSVVKYHNPVASVYGKNKGAYLRHASFGFSDMTLMNANHVDAFRELFFKDGGTILDLNKNFSSWSDELYCCNMWTDMDLKQLVNPYYTDNMINNLAQTTHQLRNNISAVHDFGTIVNNRYMTTKYILDSSGVIDGSLPFAEQRKAIVNQIKGTNQRLCTLTLDNHNRFRVVDYTDKLFNKKIDEQFFKDILENTIMLDEGMIRELSDWSKTTSIALKIQGSHAPDWLTNAYNIYKKTIRNATITMYLYGNLGTAVRNFVDSSTKGANEVMQYNESMLTYLKRYKDAVADVHEYSNIYRQIENDLGIVNRETIAKFFENNKEGLDKFNLLYGYEHTCGGDSLLQDAALKEVRNKNLEYLQDGTDINAAVADEVRKTFDGVYSSRKYYGMTNAQIERHKVEIHDECMRRLQKRFGNRLGDDKLEAMSNKFWDYHPTVTTWGDRLAEFPVLNFNRARFNNAEVRARLAIYSTFIEGGASEAEAMKHVTATQFHYAGLGKVEDFMPFTQYKLYNALYWFDHANARAVSTAWRAAQYNGDGTSTNQEISDMIAKYRQKSYYIYDKGMDAAYDEYFEKNLEPLGKSLFDAENYLGLPREFSAGNISLDGTHYLRLGNSFVEETDLVATCMASAAIFTMSARTIATSDAPTKDKIREALEAFRNTPLYDSFYSPWKSYTDLVLYAYDHKEMIAKKNGKSIEDYKLTTADIFDCYKDYFLDKNTSKQAWAGIPVVGAILSNMSSRWKNFELNKGLLAALVTDPDAKEQLYTYVRDLLSDTTGMLIPSVVGTKVEPDKEYYNYYRDSLSKVLVYNPGTFFDLQKHILELSGELQREGFTEDQAKDIMNTIMYHSPHSELSQNIWLGDRSKKDYFELIKELYADGYDPDEIVNLFRQHKIPMSDKTYDRFSVLSNALPGYLKYDKDKRSELIAYYKAMGLSADEYWAKMINNPAVIVDGRLVELTPSQVHLRNKKQSDAYRAMNTDGWLTDEEWDAYFYSLPYRYPKGKWSEAYKYFKNAGYTDAQAREILTHGYMLDESGMLVDVPGKVRAKVYSYNTMSDAEWNAYWDTVPDYTKYEKGAFGRTMKALKKMGYNDDQARALIQQGLYANKDGTLMNVTGMQRPVLGYPSFNAYYQTIPDYCKYEKGAFTRTYKALKALGFDYDTSLRLIQQGAYLMDMSTARATLQTLGARRNRDGSDIVVKDINTLILRYGGQVIIGADGKPYMLIDCSGLTRPRKTYSYNKRSGGGGRRGGGSGGRRTYGKGGYTPRTYPKRAQVPKMNSYKLRNPYLLQGNVSTFNGMTNFRGSNKLTKPYTTSGHVSTYSAQNFLNGSSYGMRKVYKIDMRQFKTGALSTKSAYPASYRNVAVAYRRNMYKDLYAKYGMSRMRMRANQQGYSNAAITRLRRNEIFNRERYAERRDLINKTKSPKRVRASI